MTLQLDSKGAPVIRLADGGYYTLRIRYKKKADDDSQPPVQIILSLDPASATPWIRPHSPVPVKILEAYNDDTVLAKVKSGEWIPMFNSDRIDGIFRQLVDAEALIDTGHRLADGEYYWAIGDLSPIKGRIKINDPKYTDFTIYNDHLLDELCQDDLAMMEYLRCALETDNPDNAVHAAKIVTLARDTREAAIRHMFDDA